MTQLLPYIQLVLSLLLIGGILLQRSEAGLGAGFGGGDSANHRHTRRGLEKILFNTTVIVAILFAVSALLPLI